MRPVFVVLAVMGLTVLNGCGQGLPPGGLPDGRTFLSASVTEEGKPRPLVAGTRIRLAFRDGTVGTDAGCNQFGGDARLDGDRLVVTNLGGTEMGCDQALMDQDEWLTEFLGSRPALRLDGDALTLTAGSTVVQFSDRRVVDPDRPLRGTRWEVDTLLDGDVASSLPAGAEAYLTFGDGGKITGHDGCNAFSGDYDVRESLITVSKLISTRKACPGEVGRAADAVQEVLGEDMVYRIEAGRLTLDTMSGKGLGLRTE